MKTFALIGAAGYIAPRHMEAIKKTGNVLVAALDPHDSVGILDSYFPDCHFFTEFERFDRHLEKLKRQGKPVDYISICSPNYLHDAHIRYGLRYGANVICEKPMVLNPWNVEAIADLEKESKGSVYNILQLRLHPAIIALKQQVEQAPKDKVFDVDLTYITPRGNWYHHSWKGDESKSGGIVTNIGIHFFDMLLWIFGNVKESQVEFRNHRKAKGSLTLDRARVNWFLSIDRKDLFSIQDKNRSLLINSDSIDFTKGFERLHIQNYSKILLEGQFRGLKDISKVILLLNDLKQ